MKMLLPDPRALPDFCDICDRRHPMSFFRKLASLDALSEATPKRLSGCSEANMSDLESDEPDEEAMYSAGLPKTLKITA